LAVLVSCLPSPSVRPPTRVATVTPPPVRLRPPTPPAPSIPAAPSASDRFVWVLGEDQLQEAVTKATATGNGNEGGLTLSNPRVDLQPGQIVIHGRITTALFPLPVQLILTASVSNGQAVPTLAAVRVGNREAGEAIRRPLEAWLRPYLTALLAANQDVFVETVTITETELRIEGRSRTP